MIRAIVVSWFVFLASAAMGANIIAGVPDFFPFGESQSGKTDMQGIFYEALDSLLSQQHSDYQIVIRPFPRLNQDVTNGNVDFTFGFQAESTTPLIQIGCHYNILVTSKKKYVENESDINGLRIGFVANGIYQRIYGNKFNTLNELVTDDESLFRMLLADRIDGFFISNVVLESYLKFGIPQANLPAGWSSMLGETYYLSASPTFIQISNKSTLPFNQVSQITRIAKQLRDDGAFSDIYKKYGIKDGGSCH